MIAAKHLLISGKVQGVGYRRFAENRALKHALRGWVRNLIDGRVECIIAGEATRIEQFITELRQGPALAKVEVIEENDVELELNQGFQVKESGEKPWFA